VWSRVEATRRRDASSAAAPAPNPALLPTPATTTAARAQRKAGTLPYLSVPHPPHRLATRICTLRPMLCAAQLAALAVIAHRAEMLCNGSRYRSPDEANGRDGGTVTSQLDYLRVAEIDTCIV